MPTDPELVGTEAVWTGIWSAIAAGLAGVGTWVKMRRPPDGSAPPPDIAADTNRKVTTLLGLVSVTDEEGTMRLREPLYHGEAMRSIAQTLDAIRELLALMRDDLHVRMGDLESEVDTIAGRAPRRRRAADRQ